MWHAQGHTADNLMESDLEPCFPALCILRHIGRQAQSSEGSSYSRVTSGQRLGTRCLNPEGWATQRLLLPSGPEP